MRPHIVISALTATALFVMAAADSRDNSKTYRTAPPDAAAASVSRGIQWLVSVQGRNGGWGQDGGETSHVRQGVHLETAGNDVANTAVAVLALAHSGNTPSSGPHAAAMRRGLEFVLGHVERSPEEGLAITDVRDTQIQRKLGPYIDTFLTSMLLSELDGNVADRQLAGRVRSALRKCTAKIERHQQSDGSWNISGGWAPVLGTSMAARSLAVAKTKGVEVKEQTMARADKYTTDNLAYAVSRPAAGAVESRGVVGGVPGGVAGGSYGGVIGGIVAGVAAAPPPPPPPAKSAAPPAALYQAAQALEQMTRTEESRRKNEVRIRQVTSQLADARYVQGFGSMGGEEFFSYLNISDSLKRSGGKPWTDWNTRIKTQLVSLQNQDGTWAGHHCITGRVAVTGAAILTLTAERQ